LIVKQTEHRAASPFEQLQSDGSFTDQVFSIAINDVDEFDVGTVTDTNATSNNVNENAAVGYDRRHYGFRQRRRRDQQHHHLFALQQ
jgi:hypothetical protein